MKLDAVFFGAHPDDVELSSGGTIAKLCHLKYSVGIVDLTRGEKGTRVSADLREQEAQQASKLLGAKLRVNLGIADTMIENNKQNQAKVIEFLRTYQPEVIFIPYWDDRHPDHVHTSVLVKESAFYSGLDKIETQHEGSLQESFRPKRTLYYVARYEFKPSFIVDVSEFFEKKMTAVKAYGSQFHNSDYQSDEPETFISRPEFLEAIEARAKHYGSLIDALYGEAFLSKENLSVQDPIGFLREGGQDANKLGMA